MRYTILAFFLLLNGNFLFSQTTDLQKNEAELVTEFGEPYEPDYEKRFEQSTKLKSLMGKMLIQPESFEYPFHALSRYVTIIESDDHRVRIFSWNELTGGTWQNYAVLVQYKTDHNGIKTQWVDSYDIGEMVEGKTNAIQKEIRNVEINGQRHYLCFGAEKCATRMYCNGIFIFSIQNDILEVCLNCIPVKYSVCEARSMNVIIHYDEIEDIISYSRYWTDYDDEYDSGPVTTEEKIRLKLSSKGYVKCDDKP